MKLMCATATFVLGLALLGSAPARAADSDIHYEVLEMSSPAAGKQAQFDSWYTEHVADLKKIPGVRSVEKWHNVQAMRADAVIPSNLTKISIDTTNVDAAADKIESLLKDGGDVLDSKLTVAGVYHPMPKVMAKDVPGTSPAMPVPGKTKPITFELLAFVGFQPGHEDEFNKGYNEQHFPGVMRNPGIIWGQREKLVRVIPKETEFPGYVAVYEYNAYDIGASNDEVNARLKDHRTPGIPFSGGKGGMSIYAVPVL